MKSLIAVIFLIAAAIPASSPAQETNSVQQLLQSLDNSIAQAEEAADSLAQIPEAAAERRANQNLLEALLAQREQLRVLLGNTPTAAEVDTSTVNTNVVQVDSAAVARAAADSLITTVVEIDSTYAARLDGLNHLAMDSSVTGAQAKNLNAVEEELRLAWKADRDSLAVQLQAMDAPVPPPPRQLVSAIASMSAADSMEAMIAQYKAQRFNGTSHQQTQRSTAGRAPLLPPQTQEVKTPQGAVIGYNHVTEIHTPARQDIELDLVNRWKDRLWVWLEDGTGETYSNEELLYPPTGRIRYGVSRGDVWFVKTRRADTYNEWVRLWVRIPWTQQRPVRLVIDRDSGQIKIYDCPDCESGFNPPRIR